MTAPLKLNHEIRGRIVPKLRRQSKQIGGIHGGDHEAWMHIAPTGQELKNWHQGPGPAVDERKRKPNDANACLVTHDTDGAIEHGTEDNPSNKGFVFGQQRSVVDEFYGRPPLSLSSPCSLQALTSGPTTSSKFALTKRARLHLDVSFISTST